MPTAPPEPGVDPDRWDDDGWDDRPPGDGRPEFPVARIAKGTWNPAPLAEPRVDPELGKLSWPERSAEVVRYSVLGAEHWLSRGGMLREWLRLNLLVAIALTLVAVLVVPPVTAVLEGAAGWTALLSKIVGNVTEAVLKLPPIVLAAATLILLFRWLRRRRAAARGGRYSDGYEPYS